jgi:hypothetical protein
LEEAFSTLAGSISDPYFRIRTHRTKAELGDMANVVNNLFLDRFSRKLVDSMKPSSLPDQTDLVAGEAKKTAGEAAPVKVLYSVKRKIDGNYELGPLEVGTLIEEFGLDKLNPATQQDILLIIKSIQEQPTGAGTKKMLSGPAKIRINGNQVTLRRFSPLDRKVEGRSTPDSLAIRVSYVITHGGVAIVDILQHREFDKKYR